MLHLISEFSGHSESTSWQSIKVQGWVVPEFAFIYTWKISDWLPPRIWWLVQRPRQKPSGHYPMYVCMFCVRWECSGDQWKGPPVYRLLSTNYISQMKQWNKILLLWRKKPFGVFHIAILFCFKFKLYKRSIIQIFIFFKF